MSSGIGTVSIDFNAEVAKFVASADTVNRKLDGVAATAKAHEGFADKMFGNVVGAELLAAGIQRVGEAALETARKLGELISRTIEADAQAARLAQTIGISVGDLQGLQSAVNVGGGVDAETFGRGLEHLSASIAKAKTEAGPARDAIEHLGLSVADLAGKNAKEQFLEIADAIKNLHASAGTKISIADDLAGGKLGKELLPALTMGREQLERFIGSAERAGVTLNKVDAAKVTEAAKAARELQQRFEGVAQQLTVALAPYIVEVTKKLEAIAPVATEMQEGFSTAIHGTAMALGYLMDGYRLLKIGVLAEAAAIVGAFEGVTKSIQKTAEALVWLANKTGQHWEVPDFVKDLQFYTDEVRKSLWEQTQDAANAPWPHEEVDKWFHNVKQEAKKTKESIEAIKPGSTAVGDFYELEKAIKKIRDDSRTKLDTFGLTEVQKQIYELKRQFGEIPAALKPMLDQALNNEAQRSFLDQQKKDIEEIARLAGDAVTPFQRWNDEIDKMNKLFAAGKISKEIYDAAQRKVNDDYEKAMHKDAGHSGGSTAALSRRFDFSLPGNSGGSKPLLENGRKQLEQQAAARLLLQQGNDVLKRIADKIGFPIASF